MILGNSEILSKQSLSDLLEETVDQELIGADLIFKKKGNFKYLLVKSQAFDGGTSLIVLIADITMIK